MEQIVSSYAAASIAASPAGLMTGQDDEQLKEAMRDGLSLTLNPRYSVASHDEEALLKQHGII